MAFCSCDILCIQILDLLILCRKLSLRCSSISSKRLGSINLCSDCINLLLEFSALNYTKFLIINALLECSNHGFKDFSLTSNQSTDTISLLNILLLCKLSLISRIVCLDQIHKICTIGHLLGIGRQTLQIRKNVSRIISLIIQFLGLARSSIQLGDQVCNSHGNTTINISDECLIRSTCLHGLIDSHLIRPNIQCSEVNLRILCRIDQSFTQILGSLQLTSDVCIQCCSSKSIGLQISNSLLDSCKRFSIALIGLECGSS